MKAYWISFIIILCGCVSGSQKEKSLSVCVLDLHLSKFEKVSLNDLQELQAHNKQFVEVEGYFHNNFEDVSICPTKRAREKESVSLSFIKDVLNHRDELNKLNGKQIVVIGKVNLGFTGPRSYMATLDSVFCIKSR